MIDDLAGGFSGRARLPETPGTDVPLIVAIHGGTYTSAYFDVPGHSLLDRAAANAIPIIAIDRAGYGRSPDLEPAAATIDGHAAALKPVLADVWARYGGGTRGIVLIGHSIGGAIAATLASAPGDLPVIGLAVSGVGLRTPTDHEAQWAALPDTPLVEMPAPLKEMLMFAPEGAFDPAAVAAGRIAYAPAPRAELLDIVGGWHKRVHDLLGRIAVPVHYRQGENDQLWIVDESEVAGFGAALTQSPRVDAKLLRGTGHCLDFHHIGPAFQLQQLGFALQCAVAN